MFSFSYAEANLLY